MSLHHVLSLPLLFAAAAMSTACEQVDALLPEYDAAISRAAYGSPCDRPGQDICNGVDLISRCNEDGRIEFSASSCVAGVCHEGNGTASCVDPELIPCEAHACAADGGEALRCTPAGFVGARWRCEADQTCVEADGEAACVLLTLEPCDGDVCSDDAGSAIRCAPNGYIEARQTCGEGLVCARGERGLGCVADPPTPCSDAQHVCAADGSAVLQPGCDTHVGLALPPTVVRTCDAELETCIERDRVADCALREEIACEANYTVVEGELSMAEGPMPVVCDADRVTRCGAHGLAALVTRCDTACVERPFLGNLIVGVCEDYPWPW